MNFRILPILALLLIIGNANADTLSFNDGTTIDGTVVSEDENSVSIQVGKGRMTFSREEIKQLEKNDKEGDDVKISQMAGEKHNKELQERTGLTREQRDQVRAAISPLWSADEEQRRLARADLQKLAKDMPVFQFIESFPPIQKAPSFQSS